MAEVESFLSKAGLYLSPRLRLLIDLWIIPESMFCVCVCVCVCVCIYVDSGEAGGCAGLGGSRDVRSLRTSHELCPECGRYCPGPWHHRLL